MTEKQLAKQAEKEAKAKQKLEKEIARTESLMVYERRFADKGRIAGIDEVGRGPLSGPVVACAVILPTDHRILYLNDSKKLSEKKREELYEVIMQEAVSPHVDIPTPDRIIQASGNIDLPVELPRMNCAKHRCDTAAVFQGKRVTKILPVGVCVVRTSVESQPGVRAPEQFSV